MPDYVELLKDFQKEQITKILFITKSLLLSIRKMALYYFILFFYRTFLLSLNKLFYESVFFYLSFSSELETHYIFSMSYNIFYTSKLV